jgi:hypothetical protein
LAQRKRDLLFGVFGFLHGKTASGERLVLPKNSTSKRYKWLGGGQ